MARGERVVLFLEHQVGRASVEKQRRYRSFLVAAPLHDCAEGLHLRFLVQCMRRTPTRRRESVLELFSAANKHQVGGVRRRGRLQRDRAHRLMIYEAREFLGWGDSSQVWTAGGLGPLQWLRKLDRHLD